MSASIVDQNVDGAVSNNALPVGRFSYIERNAGATARVLCNQLIRMLATAIYSEANDVMLVFFKEGKRHRAAKPTVAARNKDGSRTHSGFLSKRAPIA